MAKKVWSSGEQVSATDLNGNFDIAIGAMPFYISHNGSGDSTVNSITLSLNTTAHLGAMFLPAAITVNKITIAVGSVTVAGTAKIGVYSSDGATKLIDVTTPTLASGGISTSVSSITLSAGIYYLVIVPVSTTNVTVRGMLHQGVFASEGLLAPASEPPLEGTMTVTAGTLPTSFNPVSGVTSSDGHLLLARFDN